MMRRRVMVAAAASVVLVGGCADDDSGTAVTTTTTPAAPTLVIQVSTSAIGGPGGPVAEDLPELTAYDDGRVVFWGDFGFDGQVPRMFEATVPRSELDTLLSEARDAGLLDDPPPDTGEGGFEALPTEVILSDGGATQTLVVTGLDRDDAPALTAEQRAARDAIRRLRDQLLALAEGAASAYTPVELAAYAARREPGARGVTPWPADRPLSEGEEVEGIHERCLLLTGEAASAVLEIASEADSDRWSSGGENWIVFLRPLLPHEHTCPSR